MARPDRHCFGVTLTLNEVPAEPIDFVMPVWAPGMYSVTEPERNLISFEAVDKEGPLRHSKLSKNVWHVDVRMPPLTIKYQVYAFERGSACSYLDADHAVINPGTLLGYPKGYEHSKAILRLSPSSYCRNVSTGLVRLAQDLPTFVAADYDDLVDSPIMVGNIKSHFFLQGGKKHEVAVFGGEELDHKRLVDFLRRIVTAASRVYGELPYERYVFLIDVDGNMPDDGLEHHDSTYCLVPRLAFTTEHGLKRMLGLFCHEYFHLWNVKRMRPAPLVRIDYERESYTKSLWVAEGITTYYEHLLLRRAKIYSVAEFLDNVVDLINRYLSTPGRQFQSAEESSYDAWIKFYRPNESSINTGISYYTIGALLGMIIDLEIRKATKNEKSLDDAMRKTYQDTYGKRLGYTDEQFQAACEFVAGRSLDGLFENHVRGTRDIPFGHYLGFAGLELVPRPGAKGRGFAGIKLTSNTDRLTMDSVLWATPASKAGLSAGDEVIGVDGIRVDRENLRFLVENSKPGRIMQVTVGRAGRLREIVLRLGSRPVSQYRIQKGQRVNSGEKFLFKGWLGQDWRERLEYKDWNLPPAIDWLFFKLDYF
jgi:predicted metalloprotease with PDZ domain